MRQQHRLGINLAGRVLNPIERLNVPAKAAPIGIGLAYMLRGYPMVDDALADDLERALWTFGQLRRQLEVLEWGRFVPMTPADRPEVLALARADERAERPLLVIARREAGAALSLPLGVGRFNPDKLLSLADERSGAGLGARRWRLARFAAERRGKLACLAQ